MIAISVYIWSFAPRFRRNAFGWRSDTPIQRLKEAVAEIKLVDRKEPAIASEGAVVLLEKLSPALEYVDSSSGAMGSAVNRAIDALVPLIANAQVDRGARQQWLERLWEAVEDDGMGYIESLADRWGELCATQELASSWADEFLPSVERVWNSRSTGYGFAKCTGACLASLYAAGRQEQLLELLTKAPFKCWHDRRWGVKALQALGRSAEAVRYAEDSRALNDSSGQIAQACESILLSAGMAEEAYSRYALQATQGATNLATFRALTKKYPHKLPHDILRDLVASQPGSEGKWFAAAKDAKLFGLATQLAARSPTDPRTLARAARDYCTAQPAFAVASGLSALHWIAMGYGYDIAGHDVLDAYLAMLQAGAAAGIEEQELVDQVRKLTAGSQHSSQFLKAVLGQHLGA